MSRPRANGVVTRHRDPAVQRVLIGETYLDSSSGILVRVIDSRRPGTHDSLLFVVESVGGGRLGQRWECEETDLEPARGVPAASEVERWVALFQSAKEALLRAERLPRNGRGLPVDPSVAPLAAALRRMAHELALALRNDPVREEGRSSAFTDEPGHGGSGLARSTS